MKKVLFFKTLVTRTVFNKSDSARSQKPPSYRPSKKLNGPSQDN